MSRAVFEVLMSNARKVMGGLSDNRQVSNASKYDMVSVGMGGLSVFFMQDQSFLSHQKHLKEQSGNDNFKNIFGVEKIPVPNQIRNILDGVDVKELADLYDEGLSVLKDGGGLEEFKFMGDGYLIALDGTEHNSSQKVSCPYCNTKEHKNGDITYFHSMVAASIVSPDIKDAIALIPEFIVPQDGHTKQDCENAGIKRWLEAHSQRYKHLKPTILGDDLLSRQPICEAVLAQDFNYIFVCKPESHKTLYEYISGAEVGRPTTKRQKRQKKYHYRYKFINQIPVKDGKDALLVNWLEVIETDSKGKVMYRNSFITNHMITKETVTILADSGRARWKIENENNNTLKTKGYNFEHNYGHGKKNLSNVLASLAVVAFLYHTVMGRIDMLYIKARNKGHTRQEFFSRIRAFASLIIFQSWDNLMAFLIKPPDNLRCNPD